VIADTFNNGSCSRVSDGKTLGCDTSEETLTGCCSVETDVTDNYVFFGFEDRVSRWVDDKATA
jgi:hypothetical protein